VKTMAYIGQADALGETFYVEVADPAVARDFRQIMGEESGHVAWGSGLRNRLEREAPALSRIVEHYIDLTDQVYPAVINRSQSRAWQQLRARLAVG